MFRTGLYHWQLWKSHAACKGLSSSPWAPPPLPFPSLLWLPLQLGSSNPPLPLLLCLFFSCYCTGNGGSGTQYPSVFGEPTAKEVRGKLLTCISSTVEVGRRTVTLPTCMVQWWKEPENSWWGTAGEPTAGGGLKGAAVPTICSPWPLRSWRTLV